MTRPIDFKGSLSDRTDRGANFVEFVLLIMLIAIIAIAGIRAFGNQLGTTYSEITSRVNQEMNDHP